MKTEMTLEELMKKYSEEHKAAVIHDGQLVGFVTEKGEIEND